MKFLGPIAFGLAVVTLLAVTAGVGITRRDNQDLSLRDAFVVFVVYVMVVVTICASIDAITAMVQAWRT